MACGGDDDDGDQPAATTDAPDGDDDDETDAPGDETDAPDDGDDGDDDGDAIEVCSLLTDEEASEIVGEEVEGENADFAPFYACHWDAESDFDYVSVEIFAGREDEIDSYFELTDDAEEVDGFGERAQWSDTFGNLEIDNGNYDVVIVVSVDDLDDDASLEAAKDLAEIVLERLE